MQIQKSESIAELTKALCKVQGEVESTKKNAKNPFFKSDYSDLTQVWQTAKKPLQDNGFSIAQFGDTDDQGNNYLVTMLMHESGEYLVGRFKLVMQKQDMQALGSGITYARRYSLMSMIGLCPADDDAESTMERASNKSTNDLYTKLRNQATELAKKKFKNQDEYMAWRIDNSLTEDLDKATSSDLTKIILELGKVGKDVAKI
ncbi:MAG: ERF family protein [Thermodesulfobacteriota bacterium]